MGKNKNGHTTGKKIFIISLIVLALVFTIYFIAADIKFTEVNVPANGTTTTEDSQQFEFNFSTDYINNTVWEFDGVNKSFDVGVLNEINFDNRTSLGESPTIAKDITPNGNNAVIVNGAAFVEEGGLRHGYYNLDGSNDYINLTQPTRIFLTNNQTSFCMWINVTAFTSAKTLFGAGNSWNNYLWMPLDPSTISLRVYINLTTMANTCGTSIGSLSTNTWYHVCGIINMNENGFCTLYVNNFTANDTSVNGSLYNFGPSNENGSIIIGGLSNGGSPGDFDITNFKMWNRTISGIEVSDEYYSQRTKYDSENWSFNYNQSLNYSSERLNEENPTYDNLYKLCVSNLTNENCSAEKTLTQEIPNIMLQSNFSESVGMLADDRFGFNIHYGSYFTTDSQYLWHRDKWEDIQETKHGRFDQSLDSFFGGPYNFDFEAWKVTNKTFTSTTGLEMPYGWLVYPQFSNGTAYRTNDSHSGNYALQINSTPSSIYLSRGEGIGNIRYNNNTQYNYSIWVKGQGTGLITMQDRENGYASCGGETKTLNSTWQLIKGACNTSSGAVKMSTNYSETRYRIIIQGSSMSNITIDDFNISIGDAPLPEYWIKSETLVPTWQSRFDYIINVTGSKAMVITSYMPIFAADLASPYCNVSYSYNDCPPKDNDLFGRLNQLWWDYVTVNGTRYNMSMFLDECWNEPDISFWTRLISGSSNQTRVSLYIDMCNATNFHMNESYPEVKLLGPSIAGNGCSTPAAYLLMNSSISNFSVYPQFEVSAHCYQTTQFDYMATGTIKIQNLCNTLIGRDCNGIWWSEMNFGHGNDVANSNWIRNTTSRWNEWDSYMTSAFITTFNTDPSINHITIYQWTDNCNYSSGCSEYPQQWNSVSSPIYHNRTYPTYWSIYNFSVACPDGSEIMRTFSPEYNVSILACNNSNLYSIVVDNHLNHKAANLSINLSRNDGTLVYPYPWIYNIENNVMLNVSNGMIELNVTNPYDSIWLSSGSGPEITFESPTPENNSANRGTGSIVASVSSPTGLNISSFIDFDNSLRGYWNFDYYNSTGVFDNSSKGNFLTYRNASSSSDFYTGIFGKAVYFNGVNKTLNIPSSYVDYVNSSYSFWIYSQSTSAKRLCKFGSGYFNINGTGSLQQGWHNGTNYYYGQLTPLGSINEWEHFVITNEKVGTYTNVTMYRNGEFSFTQLMPGAKGQSTMGYIGGSDDFWTSSYKGYFDEVKAYNRTLTAAEALAEYNTSSHELSYTFSNLPAGQHTYKVYAIDSLGVLNIVTRNFWSDLNTVHIIIKQVKHLFLKKTGKISLTS